MNEDEKNKVTHRFEPGSDGKGIALNLQIDSEHAEEMSELFKEVSDSKPKDLQEFFQRLAVIQDLKIKT